MHHLMHHVLCKSCMVRCYNVATMARCRFHCTDSGWQDLYSRAQVGAIGYAWTSYAISYRSQKTLVLDSSLPDTQIPSYIAALLILITYSQLEMTCYTAFKCYTVFNYYPQYRSIF
jgi:hypothetical protein